ncbi:MAG: hypothetical protein COV74_06635 [Candidatus Omnitrophica bacterium CG11_big_fil_rev_8_21_14_0_20_45_26]|uniref:Toxin-antitoxin system YwqK family antitoxin n=1 Tax=Candidatus Abzuiibacterium crystallinum TaxID=1974748 RepID=A0A2H0LNP5_9BACT|nr:MAG: hypothetical protein COV74_06635 [Candidatus Omnitrophica bacterium CG11_big_fil_rev_8_21_14_0_20_45_26]PIW65762.1 MAG: hypothetical protein COW12_00165 [Candidatus Omnitrophica bacterium CG12_big_fil_rev_8_21_14_0_65_45_16]
MPRRFVMTVIGGMVLILALFIRLVGIGEPNAKKDAALREDPNLKKSVFHERQAGSFYSASHQDSQNTRSNVLVPRMEKVETSQAAVRHVLKTFYENGVVSSEWPYTSGEPDGTVKAYYDNGMLWREWTFVNGVREGIEKAYYPNGTLWMSANFQNGVQEGLARIYYPNGAVWIESNYVHGRLVKGRSAYSEIARPAASPKEKNVLTAESTAALEQMSGTAVSLSDAQADVIQTRFADDSVSSRWVFEQGELNGVSQLYHPNGAIWQGMHFTDGQPDGRWNTFYLKGSIWEAHVYRGGISEDTQRIYYPSQKVWIEFEYENGKLKEPPRAYSESGKIFQEAKEVEEPKELQIEVTVEGEVPSAETAETKSELKLS